MRPPGSETGAGTWLCGMGEAQKGSKQENDRVRFVDGGEQGQIQADDARVLEEVVKPGPGQACP